MGGFRRQPHPGSAWRTHDQAHLRPGLPHRPAPEGPQPGAVQRPHRWASLPNTATAQELFNSCAANGDGQKDHSAMVLRPWSAMANHKVAVTPRNISLSFLALAVGSAGKDTFAMQHVRKSPAGALGGHRPFVLACLRNCRGICHGAHPPTLSSPLRWRLASTSALPNIVLAQGRRARSLKPAMAASVAGPKTACRFSAAFPMAATPAARTASCRRRRPTKWARRARGRRLGPYRAEAGFGRRAQHLWRHGAVERLSRRHFEEDCLTLNVWTPGTDNRQARRGLHHPMAAASPPAPAT